MTSIKPTSTRFVLAEPQPDVSQLESHGFMALELSQAGHGNRIGVPRSDATPPQASSPLFRLSTFLASRDLSSCYFEVNQLSRPSNQGLRSFQSHVRGVGSCVGKQQEVTFAPSQERSIRISKLVSAPMLFQRRSPAVFKCKPVKTGVSEFLPCPARNSVVHANVTSFGSSLTARGGGSLDPASFSTDIFTHHPTLHQSPLRLPSCRKSL